MSDEVTPKTNYQNRRIWGMANQLALEEELLRDVVEEITGQRRISALSFDQAHDVIMALTRQLNKVRQGHRRMGAPSDRVSQNQLRAIMILRVRRGWDIWQLRSWMKRSFGVQREEWLTNADFGENYHGFRSKITTHSERSDAGCLIIVKW